MLRMCYDTGMEPTSIAQRELRNDSARILREVQEGREFVITVRGKPVARLSPTRLQRHVGPRRAVPLDEARPVIERARRAFAGAGLRDARDATDGEIRER